MIKLTDERTKKQRNDWMKEGRNERTIEWINEWTKDWANRWLSKQTNDYWEGGEVFASNHLKSSPLPRFLSLDQTLHLGSEQVLYIISHSEDWDSTLLDSGNDNISSFLKKAHFWIRLSKWGVEGPHLLRGSIFQALRHFVCGKIIKLNVAEIQKLLLSAGKQTLCQCRVDDCN